MLKDSTWPNWRMKMSKSTVIKDKDWKKFIQYMEAEKLKSNDQICEKHKAECKMYWINWAYSLWYKWMITGTHKDHELVDFSEPSRAQTIVNDLLTDEKSALNDRIMKTNIIEDWRLISRNITEEASKQFHELISETWNNIDAENDEIYSLKNQELDKNMQKWIAIKELLIKFRDTKNMKLFNDVLSTIKESKELKSEGDNVLNEVINNLEKHELFWINNQIEWKFELLESDLKQSKYLEININMKNELADKIIFINDDQDTTIYIIDYKLFKDKWYTKLELELNSKFDLEKSSQICEIKPSFQRLRIGKLIRKKDPHIQMENTLLKFRLLIWKDNNNYIKKCRDKVNKLIINKLNQFFKNKI